MFTEKQIIGLARTLRQAWEQADHLAGAVPESDAEGNCWYARIEAEDVRQVLADLRARVFALGDHARADDPRETELRAILVGSPEREGLSRLRELLADPELRDMARQIAASRIPEVRRGWNGG